VTTTDAVPYVWMIVWQHSSGRWFAWEFVRATRRKSELFEPLRAVRRKHPKDTFRLRKFVMVQP
jgi:hypothetical protein